MRKLLGMLFLDMSLAVALVGGIYFFQYRIPHRLEPVETAVRESSMGDKPTSDMSVENMTVNGMPAEAVQGEWREKFGGHFTKEVQINDRHYSGPSVAVDIYECSYGEGGDQVTYYLADVYVASIDCLQTGLAMDTYGVGYTEGLDVMAGRAQAVTAINGDSYSSDGRMENETMIRNGAVYSLGQNWQDFCVLYRDGVMKTYGAGEFDQEKDSLENIWQTWNFGPALLDENGEIPKEYHTNDYLRENHPRTAIGYYEPGHYCLMVVDGRQENFSRGMSLEEMSDVFHELGCSVAYNLDGGHCSFMTFGAEIASHPYSYSDDISDFIYVAELNT